MVDWVGFEPTTLHLRSAHSTPELPALVQVDFLTAINLLSLKVGRDTREIAFCIRTKKYNE